jgi:RluA family pseudouridine synthase
VHRIDRETSGLLVVAKNQKAAQDLSVQFQNKTAHKEYLALLQGNVPQKSGTIENYVAKGQVFADKDDVPEGTVVQRAITEYKVLGEAAGVVTWVLFSPKTGRTHQLRLHSAFSLNAPIVGDDLYGKRSDELDGILGSFLTTQKLFLFAYRITFRHPGSGKEMTVRADVPNFMQSVIKFLELKLP